MRQRVRMQSQPPLPVDNKILSRPTVNGVLKQAGLLKASVRLILAKTNIERHSSNDCRSDEKGGEMALLKVGSKAPDFKAADQNGKIVSLGDYKGKMIVLYFYPKDDTPGCTKEACSFRDHFGKFKKLGAEVLGVSVDSEKSHESFAKKYGLPFVLLADTEKRIVGAYGVWGEKFMYGRKYMGTNRVTYLIDTAGRIAVVFPKVKPAEHAEEILASIRDMGNRS